MSSSIADGIAQHSDKLNRIYAILAGFSKHYSDLLRNVSLDEGEDFGFRSDYLYSSIG